MQCLNIFNISEIPEDLIVHIDTPTHPRLHATPMNQLYALISVF